MDSDEQVYEATVFIQLQWSKLIKFYLTIEFKRYYKFCDFLNLHVSGITSNKIKYL